MKTTIGVNERGQRVGESHPSAKLTDHEVDLLLELHEGEGWGYRRLARKFDISTVAVRKIIKGKCRCQRPTRWKVVNLPDEQ